MYGAGGFRHGSNVDDVGETGMRKEGGQVKVFIASWKGRGDEKQETRLLWLGPFQPSSKRS